MWLTNGGSSNLIALLVKTDEGAENAHQNLTTFLVEKPEGFGEVAPGPTIPGKIEVGRVNVAAWACGIAIRAFELAVEYAQQRKTFGKAIAEHQVVAFKLAEMATRSRRPT